MEISLDPNDRDYDPRIKHPDVLLNRARPVFNGVPPSEARSKIFQLEQELRELKQRYNRDMDAWKEYEKRVAEWKVLVLQVVEQIRAEGKLRSK